MNLSEPTDKRNIMAKSLSDFVETCVDLNIFNGLTLPKWDFYLRVRDWNIVPVQTQKYTVQVIYLNDGQPFFKQG